MCREFRWERKYCDTSSLSSYLSHGFSLRRLIYRYVYPSLICNRFTFSFIPTFARVHRTEVFFSLSDIGTEEKWRREEEWCGKQARTPLPPHPHFAHGCTCGAGDYIEMTNAACCCHANHSSGTHRVAVSPQYNKSTQLQVTRLFPSDRWRQCNKQQSATPWWRKTNLVRYSYTDYI